MSAKVQPNAHPPVPVREGHDIAESQLLAFLQFLILAVEAYPANCWAPAWQQVSPEAILTLKSEGIVCIVSKSNVKLLYGDVRYYQISEDPHHSSVEG